MTSDETKKAPARSDFLRQFLSFQDDFMGYLYLLTGNRDASLEVFQNAAVVVLEFDKLDEIENFRAWSREVVRRQALLYLRRESTQRKHCRTLAPELIDAVSEVFVSNRTHMREAQVFEDCFEKLSEDQKRMIDLRYGSGFGFDQIASTINSTAAAIQRSLSRIREQLRGCIQRRLAEEQS
jgi:RNA polymerase sigma-70 factor, ECF subfamily